jgi:hypothetical protein
LVVQDGSALSSEEREAIIKAAGEEVAVGDSQGSRFFEDPYTLQAGKAEDAARGVEDRMRVDHDGFYARLANKNAIEEEAREFSAGGSPQENDRLRDIFDYVLNRETSEEEYPNGTRDKGRGSVDPMHFTSHHIAQEARLTPKQVQSLRIYTTFAYKYMNNPLRDEERYQNGEAVPLPVVTHFAVEAIKKLRARKIGKRNIVVWRGMRNTQVSPAFMKEGGTELGFLSTTVNPSVAVRYSLSKHALLFKILVPNFADAGAEVKWLSAFPNEEEMLFPPLTFLQPTGRTDRVEAKDKHGNPVTFDVIEVEASIVA